MTVPRSATIQASANAAVRAHLDAHPEDWAGAYAAFGRAFEAALPPSTDPPLAAPPGLDWYDRREGRNAEPLVRDDIPILTAETVDEAALAEARNEIRFAYGTRTMGMFREIVEHLAAVRGETPDAIESVGHVLYFHPDEAADYIRDRLGRAR